jgi:4-oxalomesaconate tautomerase
MLRAISCTIMRGGTSKGLYFDSQALPAQVALRDRVLLAAMGSPDARQIDGLGGAHPLTSKVAIVGPPSRSDADVDYLFLQVGVDTSEVSDQQNCGNLLAGVGPWAIEHGWVSALEGKTPVRIHMCNTASMAVATIETPNRKVQYEGAARIDGVPGTAAPIAIEFMDVTGSSCGALLPTGARTDQIEGVAVTCIDNGMPVVLLRASDFGKSGRETPAELEGDAALTKRIESIRRALGPRMNLGDVARATVPKMCLVSLAEHGGTLSTRTFIPHRVHEAIGVLGALSVATAAVIPGTVAAAVAGSTIAAGAQSIEVEHPTGSFRVDVDIDTSQAVPIVRRAALLRTARKLMSGELYVPESLWTSA